MTTKLFWHQIALILKYWPTQYDHKTIFTSNMSKNKYLKYDRPFTTSNNRDSIQKRYPLQTTKKYTRYHLGNQPMSECPMIYHTVYHISYISIRKVTYATYSTYTQTKMKPNTAGDFFVLHSFQIHFQIATFINHFPFVPFKDTPIHPTYKINTKWSIKMFYW
jgi:hypothetical protein